MPACLLTRRLFRLVVLWRRQGLLIKFALLDRVSTSKNYSSTFSSVFFLLFPCPCALCVCDGERQRGRFEQSLRAMKTSVEWKFGRMHGISMQCGAEHNHLQSLHSNPYWSSRCALLTLHLTALYVVLCPLRSLFSWLVHPIKYHVFSQSLYVVFYNHVFIFCYRPRHNHNVPHTSLLGCRSPSCCMCHCLQIPCPSW